MAREVPGGFMTYDDAQAWPDVSEQFPQMTIYYILLLKKGPIWSTDPMVKVGRLIFELHAWMVVKNILP
jgi:hypothetical protein